MRLSVENRKEVAKTIYSALVNVKGEKLVNVTATNIKDEICIELTCNKVLRDAKNRAQIWVCATRIDVWHGATFDKDFDGDNVLFTSKDWESRTIKNVVDKAGNTKEKLTRFNDVSEFIPLMLDGICNIAQGKRVNIDETMKALSEAVKATENKPTENAQGEKTTAKRTSAKKSENATKTPTTKKGENVKGEKKTPTAKRTGKKEKAQ